MKLRNNLMITATLIVLTILAAVLFVYSGIYNVAADKPHTGIGYALIDAIKNRSISVRSDDMKVPNLEDDELLASGAEHYAAMCTGCHLAPGMGDTELRQGLYPTPPNLAEHAIHDPAEAFWVIKHGVKFTGMPAWGETHDDESIWGLVAFLNKLPELSAEEYDVIVASAGAGGHSHGSGEYHGGEGYSHEKTEGTDDGHRHNHEKPEHTMEGNGSHEDAVGNGHEYGGGSGEHHHARPEMPTEVLDAFHHALEEDKGEAALSFLADNALILEGGHAQSREEYAASHLASDIKFLDAMQAEQLSRNVINGESQVTVITQTHLKGSYQGKDIDIISSETAVLERRDGKWRIIHLHWSS